ncbi:Outer membrane efflux protein [Entomobacter blattae]|uniref:Outer membrane efflux protein n=2 Tax=Entomobacter blattae TaxID=2762277 RepID=A0A7H1NQJ7_9PROT|nr:Outer membrane efflux protein [Entomobacter blattae]
MILSVVVFNSTAYAITLQEAIAKAWQVDPARKAFTTDKEAEYNKADAAHSWFPGGPTLNGQYFDDHAIGSNQGYTTYQFGVSVPVWLPGQRDATIQEALSNNKVAIENLAVEKMLIGIRVLDAATEASLYKNQVMILEQEKEALLHIRKLSDSLYTHGEIASTDLDAIIAWLEDVERELATAQEQYINFRAMVQQLTLQDEVPDILMIDGQGLLRQNVKDLNLIVEHDPRMKLAQAVLSSAEATHERAKSSFMPAPQVGVMGIHEKQYGSPWNSRIGFEVSVPLPSEARNVPMQMDAVKKIASAEQLVVSSKRAIYAEYIKLRARFWASLKVVRHTTEKYNALENRLNSMAKAWSVGEVASIEFVRARHQALLARREKIAADIMWRSALLRILITGRRYP